MEDQTQLARRFNRSKAGVWDQLIGGGRELTSLAAVGKLNPFVRLCVLLQLGYNCELVRR